ncbi:MAG: signal peptidase II [Oscillospiraceae bacterium]|jgi:signal peptidase II|nr:signal peptidase II [Oscillospiraceae bacterium]
MPYAIVTVLVLILDQAVKYWTSLNLEPGQTQAFIPGFLQLTNVHNTGAALGLLSGGRWLFVALTLIVAIGGLILLSTNRIKGRLGRWTLVLILAGGIGNCIDRIISGYVVDTFQFIFEIPLIGEFPVFNVADIFVTVCGILFCVYLIVHRSPEAETERLPAEETPHKTPRPKEPTVRADYITQLKKPVAEGLKNIEAERAARAAELARAQGETADLDAPDPSPLSEPMPKTAPRPAETDYSALFSEPPESPTPAPGASRPTPNAGPAAADSAPPAKSPEKPAGNGGDGFSIDDIIAEFRDK